MSQDTEARLLKIIALLKTQTIDGTLEWRESFARSYQATLAGQTLVLSKEDVGLGSVLEIRGKKGEVIERIEKLDIRAVTNPGPALNPVRFSSAVTDAVDELHSLVERRKETMLETTLNNLLNVLESRSR